MKDFSMIRAWRKILKVRRRAGELMHSGPLYRPVFVFTQHRSGGTLLARLLNCHDKLVVWGEHGGFLDGLADARTQLECWSEQLPERSTRELRQYVRAERLADVKFRPWMSPFSPADYTEQCRRLLLSLFTRGLQRGQRWGFKEIRYHRPELIQFLRELFPRGQFLLLERDMADLCVSSLLAPWALKRLTDAGVGQDKSALQQKVRDHLHYLVLMRHNWKYALAAAKAPSLSVQYENIVANMESEMERIFQFLDLPVNQLVRERMRVSIATIAGGTPKETIAAQDRGYLTAAIIRETVQQLLPEVEALVARSTDSILPEPVQPMVAE
jgi:Sulfotransferase family